MDTMTAEYHAAKFAALKKEQECRNAIDSCLAGREMTVGELLDKRIASLESEIFNLRDLKGSLPGSFLNSGASRISGVL